MGNYRRGPPSGQMQFAFPPLTPLARNVLIGIGALWILEMLVVNFGGIDLYSLLAWSPTLTLGDQFAGPELADVWQPFTQLLVQGPDLFGVLMTGLVAYFFIPAVVDRYTRVEIIRAGLFAVLGCIPAGWLWVWLAASAVSFGYEPAQSWLSGLGMGWEPLVLAMMVLFSMARPEAQVSLMFVFPMKAKHFIWLILGFLALAFLMAPVAGTFQYFGAVGAVLAWYHLMGPGSRTRKLRTAGRNIERSLRVLPGGRNDDDPWVN